MKLRSEIGSWEENWEPKFFIGLPKMHGRIRIGLSKVHGRTRIGLPKVHGQFRIGPPQVSDAIYPH